MTKEKKPKLVRGTFMFRKEDLEWLSRRAEANGGASMSVVIRQLIDAERAREREAGLSVPAS